MRARRLPTSLALVLWALPLAACGDKADGDTGPPTDADDSAPGDRDGDGHASTSDGGDDCDDDDAGVHPGADEICDGVDNDCDDEIDEGATTTLYVDADGDGFGDVAQPIEACEAAAGLVADATDCDDADAGRHPAADEVCDEVDNDCDGEIDEDPVDGTTFHVDADGDGRGDPAAPVVTCALRDGLVDDATDCDDAEPRAWGGAAEVCDGIDNDCDGAGDTGLVPTVHATLQAAVDALPDGADICVEPGTYTEQLDLTGRTLTFTGQQGAASTILDVGSAAPMISIVGGSETFGAGDISWSGFTVTGADVTDTHGGFALVEGGTLALSDVVFSGNVGTQTEDDALAGMLVFARDARLSLRDVAVEDLSIEVAGDLPGGVVSVEGGELTVASFTATDIAYTSAPGCSWAAVAGGALYVADEAIVEAAGVGVSDSVIDLSCTDSNFGTGAWISAYAVSGELVDLSVSTSEVSLRGGSDRGYLLGTVLILGVEDGPADLSVDGLELHDNTWATEAGFVSTAYPALFSEWADLSHVTVWGNQGEVRRSGTRDTGTMASLLEVRYGDTDHIDIRGNTLAADRATGPLLYFEGYGRDQSLAHFIIAGNTLEAPVVSGGAIDAYAELGSVFIQSGDVVGNTWTGAARYRVGAVTGSGDDDGDLVSFTNVQVVGNVHLDDSPMPAVNDSREPDLFSLAHANLVGNSNDETSWGDVTGTDGNLSADPLYTDVSSADPTAWDLSLRSGSPAIDAGDPSVLDADGSVSDLGAYGGPGGAGW